MAHMGITIRVIAAALDDYEWCAALMASSEPWITLGRDLDSCRNALKRPGTDLFVAKSPENHRLAGFLLVAPYGLAGSPYIAAIAVAGEMRGRGIGSDLLRFAERHFVGRAHLFLLVSSFNRNAQHLYLRRGYECVGELKDYCVPGQSELIFHKGLV
jgi:ribosomal-protein-alanine N-acetyltransferase